MAIRSGARRISITLDADLVSEIDILAKKRDMSRSEWLTWAIGNAISETHGQYGLAGLEAQRINQFQNTLLEMTKSFDNTTDSINSLIKMINVLFSGESYLNDADENTDNPRAY